MDADAYVALAAYDYPAPPSVLARLDQAISVAGADPQKVAPIVSGLLSVLERPDATLAAQQAACQRLGQLLAFGEPDPRILSVLEKLLGDPKRANLGRLALEPVSGSQVDEAFVQALGSARGPARLALVQSLGNRRVALAVPELAALLGDTDPVLVRDVAAALGRIGTDAARTALENAADRDHPPFVEARLACLSHEDGPVAATRLRAILDDPAVDAGHRSEAWLALLVREPSAAASHIIFALQGSDPTRRSAALTIAAEIRDPNLGAALAEVLPGLAPEVQEGVLAVLAVRGEAQGVAAAGALLRSPVPEVRLAALACLGRLPGTRETTLLLAKAAAGDPSDETRTARHSLARLAGPEVDSTVVAGFSDASVPLRAVFLEAAGLRGMAETAPLLLKARQDPDVLVRAAALESAGALCPPSDQEALISWCVSATDATEVSRSLKALASVTLRNHDAAARDLPILSAIDKGSKPERLRLVHVLPRLGDAPALACAARVALDGDPDQALAATTILANWPEKGALEVLVQTAERSGVETVRAAAVRGAMRIVDRQRTVPAAEPAGSVARLLAVAKDPEARRRLVLLLSRGSSEPALKLARSLMQDPQLAGDAKDAVASILANQSWPPRLTSAYAPSQLIYMVDGDPATLWHAPVEPGISFQVDFGRDRPVREIVMDAGPWESGYPEKYEICVTNDPSKAGAPCARGDGQTKKTVVDLPAGTHGRYLIVKDVGERASGEWAIYELQVD